MNCFCFWPKPTVTTVTEDDDSDANTQNPSTSTAAVTERGKVNSKGKNKKKEGSSSSSKPDQLALDIKKLKLDVGASSSGVREDRVSHSAVSFSYEELEEATQNFRPDWRLGEGGFGKVYMGYLERIKQDVAIKQLDPKGPQGIREFVTEVMTLINTNHPNLIKLFGYCAEKDRRLVVYELMPLGSLESHLLDLQPGSKPLDWNTRMKIATGAARGLEYLHDKITPPIIYRDMKSSNILLGKGYDVKLSDFGLAKVGPRGDKTHVSTRVMGTYGYCAPEYAMTGQLTFKSDIYSFGVVLLEIITGKRAYDESKPAGEQNLLSWARPLLSDRNKFSQMVDPLLKDQYHKQGLYRALAVAALCIQAHANLRPNMADVAAALQYVSSLTYDPQNSSTT